MKTVVVFCSIGLLALLGGCIGIPYPEPYGGGYGAVPPPVRYAPPPQQAPVQYAPPPVVATGCISPYIPAWYGCILPAPVYAPLYLGYPSYYGGYGGEPLFRFNFNFGKGEKRGGERHHRGR